MLRILFVLDSHIPVFSDDVLTYFDTLTPKPVQVPEPYQSINIVEKIKDHLKSHSDSRGGGIASRYWSSIPFYYDVIKDSSQFLKGITNNWDYIYIY